MKDSGRLERGGTNCSSLGQDTCEGGNKRGTGEQRGEKERPRDPDEIRELGEQRGKLDPGVASCLDTDNFSSTEEDENFRTPVYKARVFFSYLWQKMAFICKPC